MAEEQQTTSEVQSSSTTTESPLEQVYKEFKVDEVANNFQPQRVQQQQQTQTPSFDAVPDPVIDPKGFASWQRQQAEAFNKTASEVKQLAHSMASEQLRTREESDIRSAATEFVKAASTEGIDEELAEVQLGVLARKDNRFMSLWQNRGKNPQAWNAAVKAAGKTFASKFQFKTDPQLAENVRAAKQSTQSSPTTKDKSSANPLEDRLNEASKSGSFDREWQKIVNQGVL
jgi:hypothetical protein